MPGPFWNADVPGDFARIERNVAQLLQGFLTTSPQRHPLSESEVRGWHREVYAHCRVPVGGYLGNFRGSSNVPELVDYEVGVGPPQADGLPMGVGVSSTQVGAAVTRFVVQLNAGLAVLDALVPSGQRPADSDTLEAVVNLTAVAHGEWVRIHPFANGNGRTARLLCAWIALRYRLPVFVRVKPRPDDIAYAAAGRDSMGRPPDFIGDHAPTAYLFMHLLRQALTDL